MCRLVDIPVSHPSILLRWGYPWGWWSTFWREEPGPWGVAVNPPPAGGAWSLGGWRLTPCAGGAWSLGGGGASFLSTNWVLNNGWKQPSKTILMKKLNYFASSDPHHDISKQLVDTTFVWSFCHGTFAQLTIPIICFTWQSKKWHCPGHSITHARVCK